MAAALPSQALRASSPKGGAIGRPVNFPLDACGVTERATVNLWKMHDRKEKNL